MLQEKEIKFQQFPALVSAPPQTTETPPHITPEQQRVRDLERDIQRIRDEKSQFEARLQAELDATLNRSRVEAELQAAKAHEEKAQFEARLQAEHREALDKSRFEAEIQASKALELKNTMEATLKKHQDKRQEFIAEQTNAANAAIDLASATVAIRNVREFLHKTIPTVSPGRMSQLLDLAHLPADLVDFGHEGFQNELKNLIQMIIGSLPVPPSASENQLDNAGLQSTPMPASLSDVIPMTAHQTTLIKAFNGQCYLDGLSFQLV